MGAANVAPPSGRRAGFTLLEERVGENDLVVLEYQGAFAMRVHYRLRPNRSRQRHLRKRKGPIFKYVQNGVTYYVSGGAIISSPKSLAKMVRRVLVAKDLPEPERVWTLQGSRDIPLARLLRHRFPEIPFDVDVDRESNGLVFAIDTEGLRALAARARGAKGMKPVEPAARKRLP